MYVTIITIVVIIYGNKVAVIIARMGAKEMMYEVLTIVIRRKSRRRKHLHGNLNLEIMIPCVGGWDIIIMTAAFTVIISADGCFSLSRKLFLFIVVFHPEADRTAATVSRLHDDSITVC